MPEKRKFGPRFPFYGGQSAAGRRNPPTSAGCRVPDHLLNPVRPAVRREFSEGLKRAVGHSAPFVTGRKAKNDGFPLLVCGHRAQASSRKWASSFRSFRSAIKRGGNFPSFPRTIKRGEASTSAAGQDAGILGINRVHKKGKERNPMNESLLKGGDVTAAELRKQYPDVGTRIPRAAPSAAVDLAATDAADGLSPWNRCAGYVRSLVEHRAARQMLTDLQEELQRSLNHEHGVPSQAELVQKESRIQDLKGELVQLLAARRRSWRILVEDHGSRDYWEAWSRENSAALTRIRGEERPQQRRALNRALIEQRDGRAENCEAALGRLKRRERNLEANGRFIGLAQAIVSALARGQHNGAPVNGAKMFAVSLREAQRSIPVEDLVISKSGRRPPQ